MTDELDPRVEAACKSLAATAGEEWPCGEFPGKLREDMARALAAADAASSSPWRPIEDLPKKPEPGMVIDVRSTTSYRWLPYKPNSEQRKRGKLGRWQKFNGYGFDGSYSEPEGEDWQENKPLSHDEAEKAIAEALSDTPLPQKEGE